LSKIVVEGFVLEQLPELTPLLIEGYPQVDRAFWPKLRARLALLSRPAAHPEVGFVMRAQGEPVGVIIAIFSERRAGAGAGSGKLTVCNTSLWYIQPKYRALGLTMLRKIVVPGRAVTCYTAITSTLPLLEASGFAVTSNGVLYAPPGWNLEKLKPAVVRAPTAERLARLDPLEQRLVTDHVGLGCIAALVSHRGESFPFVVAAKRQGPLRVGRVIYARSVGVLERYIENVNLYLLRHGVVGLSFDAEPAKTPVRGIFRPAPSGKLQAGSDVDLRVDLAYSERVIGVDLD
jgi:hypothetical protein